MVSVEDKLNNFLVLEHFNQLEDNGLDPKLGIYEGSRLIVVSQIRTNILAKIYQLFMDIIYNPILSFLGKLSFNEEQISALQGEVRLLQSDFSDKESTLNTLTTKTEAVQKELAGKQQVLQEARMAENQIDSLNSKINQLESRLKELSLSEKECAVAEGKIANLSNTIHQLESKISALRSNA
jgi:chromosome segregation ATPase